MKKTRVLFVCVGNACRSQMAQAFARVYGSDVLEAESAGVAPATAIPAVTHNVMREKGISLAGHFPKGVPEVALHDIDLVVNLSGAPLRGAPLASVRDWRVQDPMGEKDTVHAQVRDEIERLVMTLILELRQKKPAAGPPGGPPPAPRNWRI